MNIIQRIDKAIHDFKYDVDPLYFGTRVPEFVYIGQKQNEELYEYALKTDKLEFLFRKREIHNIPILVVEVSDHLAISGATFHR